MKDAKVTQTITLTIEGKSFKLTLDEAVHLRDQLNKIINPASIADKWRQFQQAKIYTNTEPAPVPQWTPSKTTDPYPGHPKIICSVK